MLHLQMSADHLRCTPVMLILNLFSPEALCMAKSDGVNVWRVKKVKKCPPK